MADAKALPLEGQCNGFGSIASAFSNLGNYEQALATIDLIPDPGERANHLAGLAFQQAEKDDATAMQTVELASQAAQEAGKQTKPAVFGTIAITRAMLGNFSAAEEMISRMDDEAREWPLRNVTAMLVNGGRKDEAISLAESQTDPHPKAYALLGIASALIEQQEVSKKAEESARR